MNNSINLSLDFVDHAHFYRMINRCYFYHTVIPQEYNL
jgi:hypothetical protein